MAHPDAAVCSLLQTPHLGPHLCTPLSRPSLRGRFKGAWGEVRGSSRWPRRSPQLASRPAQPSRPLRAGAHGVTRRGARGPGRGAGESQPERAGRCGRARAGGQEVRAEGAERAEPAGEEEDGEGGRRGRPRPRLSEPAPRRRRALSLCLWPLDGCRAACIGDQGALPTAPRLPRALREAGTAWSRGHPLRFPKSEPGSAGRRRH